MMKKSMLALSLAVLFPLSLSSFAQTRPNLDASATILKENQTSENETIEDNEEQTDEDRYKEIRPEILRLYPDYVKVDDEDALFFKYLEHYYERQQQIPRFNKAQEQMQRYIKENAQLELRALTAKKSKIDALLYQNLSEIYSTVAHIQQQIQFYIAFNQAILKLIDFNAPLPVLSENQHRRYRTEIENMQEIYQKQEKQLLKLVRQIDQYQKILDEFHTIDSKRNYKKHLENIAQLNRFALETGHFLNAQIKAYDAFYLSTRFYDSYQTKENLQWAEKFKTYLNSVENQKKTQALLAALPKAQPQASESHVQTQLKLLENAAVQCRNVWDGQTPDEYTLAQVELSAQQFIAKCQKTKSDLQQFVQNNVDLEEISHQIGKLENLDFLGDFRIYDQDIYYTHSEKNAVYRFDSKTLKEHLIYQHPLEQKKDGCDHNMCRGVGATDVVLSKNGQIAYVASLDYNQVFAINLSNNQVIEKYKVERYPRKLLLDESGEYLFVYNGVANSISKINLQTGQIEHKALPDAYQGHFCREIDLSFSPISGNIKILGDWSDEPYIYMNTQDMSFYHSPFEVPYPVVSHVSEYRYIVKAKDRYSEYFSVYDTRLNHLVQKVGLKASQDEQNDDSDYAQKYRELNDMGNLDHFGHFFVEKVASEYSYLNHQAVDDQENDQESHERYQYLLHFIDAKTASEHQVKSFKLAFQPFKIVELDKQKILVIGAVDRSYGAQPSKIIAIYDLSDTEAQKIMKRNAAKLQAQTVLDMQDLAQDD